jgi:hypothetical protein
MVMPTTATEAATATTPALRSAYYKDRRTRHPRRLDAGRTTSTIDLPYADFVVD